MTTSYVAVPKSPFNWFGELWWVSVRILGNPLYNIGVEGCIKTVVCYHVLFFVV